LASFLSVASSLLVGLILVIAPWTGLWDANYLIELHSTVRALALSTFTRGWVTGLGLVNILLAIQETRQHFAEAQPGA